MINRKYRLIHYIESAILSLYSIIFLILIVSGKISEFIHPRYIIILAAASIAGIIISIKRFKEKSISHHHGKPILRISLMIFPLFLAFVSRNMKADFSESAGGKEIIVDKSVSYGFGKNDDMLEYRNKELIVLTDDNFLKVTQDIYDNPKLYLDKKITYTGTVMKKKFSGRKDELAVVRMVMVCCAADLAPSGFICRYDNAYEIENNSWQTITGIITVETSSDGDFPLLRILDVRHAEKPDQEYLYPF